MTLAGHRILLVEDEVLIAFDIMSIIREANGEVLAHATSLARAMKLADNPNLFLSDFGFPARIGGLFARCCEAACRRRPFHLSHSRIA